MLGLGTEAPDFRLPDTKGSTVARDDFKGSSALLVAFICNHCPYVKHVISEFTELAREYGDKDVAVVGINSNNVETHPSDSPANMAELARTLNFSFPFLYDEEQSVAKAYRAACTPDFFLFDRDFSLVYRGQMDGSRPGNDVPVSGKDLRAALDLAIKGEAIKGTQKPSLGCNIKWKPGNEPDYFN
jgi:peroxiredoxin